ncbi:MAG: caspase family protein, partial [Chloroflexota bacterium]
MAKLDPEDFPVETTQAPTRRLALVIGIDAYQPENGCPPLKTAVNDARVLANTLSSKYDYKVTTLLDEQANLAGISATLNKDQPDSWASQIEAGDQVLFYFAGHGLALKEEGGPAGYFIPQNGVSGQPDTFLAMRAVHDALTSLDSFHCLIILDCCYSGAFRWTSTRNIVRPPESTLYRETYERYSNSPAWQVLTSAAYDEKALDSVAGTGFGNREAEDTNHSPFAQALLTALQDDDTAGAKADANDDGVLIATELYLYLRDNVQITAKQTINHNQTPGIWPLAKHEKGEYIFLLGDPNDLPPAPVPDEALNPYRGLESYDEQDADLFFGRTALTQQLAKTVTQQPLTLVLGVSGTGKSSLVKAGLLPYLRRQGLDVEIEDTSPKSKTRDEQDRTSQDPTCDWYFPLLPAEKDKPAQPIRPGEHPLHELRRWLATFLSQPPTEATMRGNASSLASALSAWQPEHPQQKLLLVIDQFEELITLCQDKSERKQFIRLLLAAVEYHAEQFRIVITLRSDFEPQITALLEVLVDRYETITINTESDETGDSSNDTPASKATKRSIVARFFVPLMSPAELREVIQGPAAKAVLFFEPPSLVDTIINEVGRTPGALPLLSFTLSQLYLRYLTRYQRGETEARDLSEDDYQALGGVIGSLSKRADEEYNALDKAHKATMRRIMVRMISTEGGELTRRWVPRSELVYLSDKENERVARVLNRLTNPNVRLLVPGTFKRADGVDELYIEPAHDELVRAWNKLQTWARQSPADLPLRRELNQQANKWSAEADDNKKQNLLWPNDPRLPRLEQLVTGQAPPANQNFFIRLWRTITALWENAELNLIDNHWLNKIELDFVQTSVLRRQQDARQLVRTTLGVIAVLLGLTIFAFGQRNAAIENEERAIAERDIALSGQLAAQSARELDQPNYELALLLAIEAAYIKETLEANTVLHQALAHRGRTLAILTGHTDTVWGATWNGDESRILTWSDDGTARLWDGQDGHEVATLAGHTD